jgi:cytochrome P450
MTGQFLPTAPDHVPAKLMVDFDFFRIPPGETDPAEIWHDLVRRDVPRIFYTPRNGGHWVFLDYDDIVEAYRDHSTFSSYQASMPPMEHWPKLQPVGFDPPEHNVFRRLLAPMFTPKAIRDMSHGLTRRSVALIERFAAKGSCDFIKDYAEVFPTSAFLHLFGLPEDRLDDFLALANVFFRTNDPIVKGEAIKGIHAELESFFRKRMQDPADDLASAIVTARDDEGRPYAWQDVVNCGFLLFVAGLDTVTNTMAYIWRHLATTPHSRAYFRERLDDPDAFLRAIEELIRINAVSTIVRRVKVDTEYRGVRLRENDRVALPNTVANRDPKRFRQPQTIDLDREVNVHVTFGVGPHRCIGSHLAKREILISLQEWLRRIPDFELQEETVEGSAFGGSVMGFTHLELRWDTAPA